MVRFPRLRGLPAILSLFAVGACAAGPAPDFPAALAVPPSDPEEVESVVFLIGDAGDLERGASPILARLGQEVEYWGKGLAADSAVTVLFLGDNVYPVGIRDRDDPEFAADSSRLWGQIDALGGAAARGGRARGVFLAGNHDWGSRAGPGGVQRLRNQESQLTLARAQGWPVELVPEPGEPGPEVIDVGDGVRLLVLDTHWFLQERDEGARAAFFDRVRRGLAGAGGRHLIVAAHHPYQSAGPHGELMPGTQALGLSWLMKKSGALVQDLNSPIYGDLLDELASSFRTVARPLIFAGGHDHSLQVLDPETEDGPHTVLVSGAGSKLTDFAESPKLRYAASRPGYMSVVFRKDGAVDLFVTALASGDVSCEDTPADSRADCVRDRASAMTPVYSERLVAAGPPP